MKRSRSCSSSAASSAWNLWCGSRSGSPDRQFDALREGEAILAEGCVSHCHLSCSTRSSMSRYRRTAGQGAERHLNALAAYTAQEAFPRADFLIRRGRALISAGQGVGSAGRAPVCARCACSQKMRVRPD
ncbi:hypothetical protein [Cupriavidus necator]|uniref:hypothetical protein n=1 Tax=Cupriavidus necator TaxID=106590 RepID=UPI0012D358CC|nr:hypothetical protein [Cupriavidus necator]